MEVAMHPRPRSQGGNCSYLLRARLCRVLWPDLHTAEHPSPAPSPAAANAAAGGHARSPKGRRRKVPPAFASPEHEAPLLVAPPHTCRIRLTAPDVPDAFHIDFKAAPRAGKSKIPKRAKEATFHMSERDAASVLPVPLRLELYGVVGGDEAQRRVRRGDGVRGAGGVATPSTVERPVLVGTTSVVAALSDGYVRREALLQDAAGRTVCRASVDLWLQETHRDGGLATTSDETAADSAALPLPVPPAAVPPSSRRTLSVAYSPDTMPAPPSAPASEHVSRTSVSGRPNSAHYTSLHAGLCGSEESCAAPSYDTDPRAAFCGTVPQDGARRLDVLRMRSSCEPTPPAWVQTPEEPFRALGHVLKTLQKTVGFLLGLDAHPASVRVPGVPAGDALPFKHIHDRLVYAGDLYGQEWHRRGGDCAATASPRLSTTASVAPSSPVLPQKEDNDGALIKRLWDEERGWIDAKKQELEQLEAALMARERAVSRREELLRRRVPASIYGSSTLDQQLGQIESLHTWHTVCEHNAALSQSLLRYAPGGDGASVSDAPTKEELDSGLARIAGAQAALRETSDFHVRLQREAGKEESDRRLLTTEEGRARKVLRERAECAADDAAAAAEAAADAASAPPRLVTSPPEVVQESRAVKGAARDGAEDADPLHRQPPPPEPATSPLLPHQGQRDDDDDDDDVSLHGVGQASPATPAPPLTAASPAGPLSADVARTDDEASPVLMTSPSLTPLNRRGVAGLERGRESEDRGAVAMSHGSIATATVSGASTTSGYVNLLQQALQMDAPKDGRKSPSLELVQKALVMAEQTSSPAATEADTVRGGRTEDGLPERELSKPLPPSSEPVPATHDLAFDIPDDDDEDRFSIDTQ